MRTSLSIATLCLLALPALANEPAAQRDFGFQPLEIYEFDNGTSNLLVEDLNGDGLDDIVFANNHISRMEILIRRPDPATADAGLPELDDRFDNRGVLVDQSLRSIRIADLNGDGRKDIATFGATLGLIIRFQSEDGTFDRAERIFIKDPGQVVTTQIGDLNGDEREDILVCRDTQADIHWNRDAQPFQEKKTLFLSDGCRYGDLADINSDGITDLVFFYNSLRNSLRVRCGTGSGQYGTELPLDLPPRAYSGLVTPPDQPAKFGIILRNRQAFRIYDITEKPQPTLLKAQEESPARIPLEGTDKKDVPAWLTADVNADGFDDLLVAAPALNRLHLYHGTAAGLSSEPTPIDTLSDVFHISQAANGDLLVVSKKEKTAGIHRAGELDAFPTILSTPGDVLAGCAIARTDQYWLVCKNDEGDLLIDRTDGRGDENFYPLELQNEPNDLLAFSLPDNRTGLLLFIPYDTPKLFLCDGTALTELSSEAFRALTSPISRSNIHLDRPGDGTRLTVADGSVARRFEWETDHYTITRQLNPENADSKLVASTAYTLLDGSAGTLTYDKNSNDLIWFGADNNQTGKIHIPDADQTIFNLTQLKNKERDTVILLDRTGISEILSNGTRLTPVSEMEYVSPAEAPRFAYLRAVELGSPPRPMIALIDPANRSLELVSSRTGSLSTELIFEVYLSSDFVTRDQSFGTDPHDLRSGDLNGDSIGDLILLCQDKLIIYPGE